MTTRQQYRDTLHNLDDLDRTAYLDRHSGLPGPRANLTLMEAAADEGDPNWLESLTGSDDEYRAATGALGLGALLVRPDPALRDERTARLRALAADRRWRVREGVAMALQRLGDADPKRMWRLAREWAADPDPLVQRAAIAGVCEPRLLRAAGSAEAALDLCAAITVTLKARPATQRRRDDVRVLRQALGYCWSVAVAAAPEVGLPRFRRLDDDPDPDVAWIVRENRRKARLKRLAVQS